MAENDQPHGEAMVDGDDEQNLAESMNIDHGSGQAGVQMAENDQPRGEAMVDGDEQNLAESINIGHVSDQAGVQMVENDQITSPISIARGSGQQVCDIAERSHSEFSVRETSYIFKSHVL